jgi:alpha-glucosidase (family GH31 glycosyl hydrolase)
MISDLKKQNIRTILVTEPFILTTSSRWKEATDNKVLGKKTNGEPYTYDFYFGNTGLIDVFETKSRNWFWNIYKDLATQGISGWWGDLGEPEVHPSDLIHSVGTADQVHNAYGHCWAQMIYEGYERDFPNERPFILMRSGFAGTQRYGIIPWTGDVARSWGGLYSQPEISLQMGMQGIAYMHSDLGGFAGGEQIDNELYIRWLQYGVFQPIFRPHAQESIAPEPVFQNDTTKQHAINAINLRYKLLPYVYTMAYQNSISGKPLMIPLFFEEENNIELLDYQDAYLWGDAFLVSPVKAPNLKTQDVYFPKNSEWFDFYTEKSYVGGKTSTIKLSIDYIPAFVRGGTFLPMLKEAKNTELYSLSQFEMHYFLSQTNSESEYKLFNDDGKTPKTYEKSLYELIEFSAKNKSNSLKIDIEYIEKLYSTKNKEITFVIHNATQKPKSISVKNEKVEWSYNEELKKIEFTINFYENKEIVIKF